MTDSPFWWVSLLFDLCKDTVGLVIDAVRALRHATIAFDLLPPTHVTCSCYAPPFGVIVVSAAQVAFAEDGPRQDWRNGCAIWIVASEYCGWRVNDGGNLKVEAPISTVSVHCVNTCSSIACFKKGHLALATRKED